MNDKTADERPELYITADVAKLLGRGHAVVNHIARAYNLGVIHGGQRYFTPDEVAFIASRRNAREPRPQPPPHNRPENAQYTLKLAEFLAALRERYHIEASPTAVYSYAQDGAIGTKKGTIWYFSEDDLRYFAQNYSPRSRPPQ